MLDRQSFIQKLDLLIENPSAGLPEDLFLFVSRITPLVNVDLLIKDEQNRTLLTWRDDGFSEPGWHLPGGIVRYKEPLTSRAKAVARLELGAEVDLNPAPLAVNEIIHPTRNIRGHFIAFLFKCFLLTPPDEVLRFKSGRPKPNEWHWHATCPENIIAVHKMYEQFISPAG